MKDFLKYDNIKRLIIMWVKAFGIAVLFTLFVEVGIPAFLIVFLTAGYILYLRG